MLIEQLAKESGLRSDRLMYFAKTASKRYYVFSIPKATGGYRQIAHPARPLKALQRWFVARYLSALPVHDSAMAYRRGRNIRTNVERHIDQGFTLRVDFKDFFPSFHENHVSQYMEVIGSIKGFSTSDIDFIVKILTRYGALTIGAPSSPVLTNLMMYDFDSRVRMFSDDNGFIYTRYADDIFLSTNKPNSLGEAYEFVRDLASDFRLAELKINKSKTTFLSRRYHRELTGLVITSDGKISIGRRKKREIKALVHQFESDLLPANRVDFLRGYISFVSDVEPDFVESLSRKYGSDFLGSLFQANAKVSSSFDALIDLDPPPKPA